MQLHFLTGHRFKCQGKRGTEQGHTDDVIVLAFTLDLRLGSVITITTPQSSYGLERRRAYIYGKVADVPRPQRGGRSGIPLDG
jgi:hypothetical protein